MQDNSFGLGYFPVPARILNMGRYSDSLKPSRVEYKVYPREGIWLATTKTYPLSVMMEDLKVLLRLGLMRIQSNDPGTMTFYFQDEVISVPGDITVATYQRSR